MKQLIFILLFGLSSIGSSFSAIEYYFYVQLTDKNETPFSLDNPFEFLSQRAIDRRAFFGIAVDSTDIPVNQTYAQEIVTNGFRVHNTTKWLNGITVATQDSISIEILKNLSFVAKIEYTGKAPELVSAVRAEEVCEKTKTNEIIETELRTSGLYGAAADQINQIGGMLLHDEANRGEGIYIGVLDAGFFNADIMPAFELMRSENRLLGTRDFVNPHSNIFQENSHGSNVLSTMASYIENVYIGTAPMASYWLVRTENTSLEYPMEMDFWVSGIEFLDSLGIDVTNTSLGYRTFDNPALNFTQTQLDGRTARMSIAAEMASQKGIIVVNSAGNDGDKAWRMVGFPADASGIITVGGVTASGTASTFSSFGPTADGRIKPEIAARATATALMNNAGAFSGNGTSFSSPIIAGMMACFLQYAKNHHSNFSVDDLLQFVFRSANNFELPTDQLGYGIPNFEKAVEFLQVSSDISTGKSTYPHPIVIFVDYASQLLHINVNKQVYGENYVQVFNLKGETEFSQRFTTESISLNISHLNSGVYAVRIISPEGIATVEKIVLR